MKKFLRLFLLLLLSIVLFGCESQESLFEAVENNNLEKVAALILEDGEDPTVISYVFAAKQQPGPRNTGPDARKVTVADWLTDNELAGIRTIRVVGRENTMVTRR